MSITAHAINPSLGSNLRPADISINGFAFRFPMAYGSKGQVLSGDGAGNLSWVSTNGTGTVTSVGVKVGTMPLISIQGSPITSEGEITLNYSGKPLDITKGGTGVSVFAPYGVVQAHGMGSTQFLESTSHVVLGQSAYADSSITMYNAKNQYYTRFVQPVYQKQDTVLTLPTEYPQRDGYLLSSTVDGVLSWVTNDMGLYNNPCIRGNNVTVGNNVVLGPLPASGRIIIGAGLMGEADNTLHIKAGTSPTFKTQFNVENIRHKNGKKELEIYIDNKKYYIPLIEA